MYISLSIYISLSLDTIYTDPCPTWGGARDHRRCDISIHFPYQCQKPLQLQAPLPELEAPLPSL